MGRSSCKIPEPNSAILAGKSLQPGVVDTFLCEQFDQPMITEQGWYEMLREFTTAGQITEGSDPIWEVLWLYLPDYLNEGNMNVIENIPRLGNTQKATDPDPFWK